MASNQVSVSCSKQRGKNLAGIFMKLEAGKKKQILQLTGYDDDRAQVVADVFVYAYSIPSHSP